MTEIKANIPSRSVAGRTYAAHIKQFQLNESGQWFMNIGGEWEKVRENEVVEICQRANNWPELKASHFQMVGFHN